MRFRWISAWWEFVFTAGIAGTFACTLVWGVFFNFAATFWRPTEGRVVGIENYPKSAELRYAYAFDGTEYKGNTFAYITTGTLDDKDIINRLYPVGSVMTVYVNPIYPRQAVVERRPLEFRYVWKHLLIIAFVTPLAIRSWRKIRRLKADRRACDGKALQPAIDPG
jgi:hypothetical protein